MMVPCGLQQAVDAAGFLQIAEVQLSRPRGVTNVNTMTAMTDTNPDSAAASQHAISAEIAAIESGYQRAGVEETQPRLGYAPYRSSLLRHPTKDLHHADPEGVELWTPCFSERDVHPLEADLTIQHSRRTDRRTDGRHRPRSSTVTASPVRRQLVEIWQANAGGRYIHKRDQHPVRRSIRTSPASAGASPTTTGNYRFTTIKPGPYPWKNHRNAWRPAHIHFSLFGTEFTQRMITQMYFPGDPLFALDPIYQSITDQKARDRLVATYDHDVTTHEWATGYRWDIVLTGATALPSRPDNGGRTLMSTLLTATPGPDRRPLLRLRAAVRPRQRAGPAALAGRHPAVTATVSDGDGQAGPRRPARDLAGRRRRHHPARRLAPFAGTAGPSPAGAAPAPTTAAATASPPSSPGASEPGAAPFIMVTIFARGLLNRLFTRAYVPG